MNTRETLHQICEAPTELLVSAVLTPESQKLLLSRIRPIHPNVKAHHITIVHNPDEDELPYYNSLRGQHCRYRVVGAASDEKGQAALVECPESDNEHPHITISVAPGVKSQYINELLAKGVEPVEPFWVEADVTVEQI